MKKWLTKEKIEKISKKCSSSKKQIIDPLKIIFSTLFSCFQLLLFIFYLFKYIYMKYTLKFDGKSKILQIWLISKCHQKWKRIKTKNWPMWTTFSQLWKKKIENFSSFHLSFFFAIDFKKFCSPSTFALLGTLFSLPNGLLRLWEEKTCGPHHEKLKENYSTHEVVSFSRPLKRPS